MGVADDNKAAQEERAKAERQMVRAYARVFATKPGRAVLANLETLFSPDVPAFPRSLDQSGRYDPLKAAHLCGEQKVLIHIRKMLELGERLSKHEADQS